MLDKTYLDRLWPWLFMAVLPLCVHLPALTGWLRFDPLYVASGVTDGTWTTNGVIAGRPGWVDANAGVTTEALGALAARDWLHLTLPYWNPFNGVGLPLAAEGQNTAFFLPFGLLLAVPHGLLALRILMMMLAGVFTLALLRRLGLARMPATAGAALFQLNGVFAWMAHGPFLPVAFLPLLLLGIEQARTRPGLPWAIVLGTAWSLTAGFPETACLDGLLALGWAGLRLGQSDERARFAARVASGGGVGLLLAAPALWPFFQALPGSFVGEHVRTMGWAFLPANWSLLLFPYLLGNIHYATAMLGQFGGVWARAGGYCDLALVCLALLGLRRAGPERGLRWLLVGWIVLVLAKAAGLPGVSDGIAAIPLLGQAMWHVYVLPSWCMALAVLAGFALDDWQRGQAGGVGPVAGLACLGTAAALFLGWDDTAALWRQVATYRLYPVISLAEAGGVLGTIFLLWRRAPSARRARLLAAIVIGQAACLFAFPLLAGTRGRHLDDGSVVFLQTHAGLSRVMSFGPLVPNYGAFFGVAQLGYDYLPAPRLWVDYVREHLDPHSNGVLLQEGAAPPLARMAGLLQAYEAAGVAYILTWPGDTPFPPGAATRVHRGQVMDIWAVPDAAPYFDAPGCRLVVRSRLEVQADCAAPATLIRRELAWPGWQASRNDVPIPIGTAGEIFQAVPLPRGHTALAFAYAPPGMKYAWGGFSLGVLCCVMSMGLVRRAHP